MYVCIYVCMYVCMYVCRYVSMYVCMYVCQLLYNWIEFFSFCIKQYIGIRLCDCKVICTDNQLLTKVETRAENKLQKGNVKMKNFYNLMKTQTKHNEWCTNRLKIFLYHVLVLYRGWTKALNCSTQSSIIKWHVAAIHRHWRRGPKEGVLWAWNL